MFSRNILWLTTVAFLISSTASGQMITYDGCADFRGVPVASVMNPQHNDVASATYINGQPIIIYNPTVLSSMSRQTRLWMYAHECAHHALAHAIRNIPFSQEQEADCWGIRTLTEQGLLDDDDLLVIQRELGRFGPGDWTHLPGRQRAINLRRCLRRSSTQSAPTPPPMSLGNHCCDGFGTRRCIINPSPLGSPCFCFGQGNGMTCQ